MTIKKLNKLLEKLLNDKECDDKFTICKNHSLTDKIKNDCKEKKMLKDHNMIKNKINILWIINSKYHYLAVAKPSTFLPKFLSNHDRNKFKKLKQHHKLCNVTITLNLKYLISLK